MKSQQDRKQVSSSRSKNSPDNFDYNHSKNINFGSTRNTFNIKTLSQFHKQYKYPKLPEKTMFITWNQSATSMTRGKSPKHKIPQQKRFTSLEHDRNRSYGDRNKLDLRTQIKVGGQSFACSKRKQYFPPQDQQQTPGPSVYKVKRWIQQIDDFSIQPKNTIDCVQNRSRKCYSSAIKGRTMSRQRRDNSKYYLDHTRVHVNHHQQIVKNHPGVGRYQISTPFGKYKPAHRMGQNYKYKLDEFPASNTYNTDTSFYKPSTQKQTFDRGKRLDLAKPLNENPGPSQYKIIRYLQKNK